MQPYPRPNPLDLQALCKHSYTWISQGCYYKCLWCQKVVPPRIKTLYCSDM
jgi:hypothetical protein